MTPTVVVATAETATGAEPSRATWHHRQLVERLASGVEVDPLVLDWHGSAHKRAGTRTTPVHGPAHLAGTPALRALRVVHRPTASRAKDRLTRAWLRRHRTQPILLDGGAAGTILPWLEGHKAPIVWFIPAGDAGALAAVSPPPRLGLVVVESASDVYRVRTVVGESVEVEVEVVGRHEPILAPDRLPGPDAPLGLVGPLDDDHGVDLLPRLLWHLEAAADRPVAVRWAVEGPRPGFPPQVRHDLRNLELASRCTLEPAGADLAGWMQRVAVLVLPWRLPADPAVLDAARRAGRPCLAFTDEGAIPFPEVGQLAAAAVALLADEAERRRLAEQRPPERTTRRLLAALLDGR